MCVFRDENIFHSGRNKLQFWQHPSIEWKRVLCVSAADRQTTGAMRPAAESAFGRSKVT